MRPSSTHTSCSGRNASPSKTFTRTIAKLTSGSTSPSTSVGAGSGNTGSTPTNAATATPTYVALRAVVFSGPVIATSWLGILGAGTCSENSYR